MLLIATLNRLALPYPYHEGMLCSKFGLTPSSGLGGDNVMDARQTDGKIVLLSQTLTMRGSDVTRLVEFRSVVYEEIA